LDFFDVGHGVSFLFLPLSVVTVVDSKVSGAGTVFEPRAGVYRVVFIDVGRFLFLSFARQFRVLDISYPIA